MKIPEDGIRQNLGNHEVSKMFLKRTQKAQTTKDKW